MCPRGDTVSARDAVAAGAWVDNGSARDAVSCEAVDDNIHGEQRLINSVS
jgi:hypothetical protein